jgi:RNA polymerase sigma-70 factor (ECF subfamily)
MNSCTDIEIINRIRNGSTADFRLLVDRYSDRINSFLMAKSKNRNDHDDILQETFLKAYLNLNSYQDTFQFSSWLYTIAYHELCRFYTKSKNKKEENLGSFEKIQEARNSESIGIWEEASRLQINFYTVLWLKYHEELDVKEIAIVMKSSVALVKINLFRARNQLKKIIVSDGKICQNKGVTTQSFLSQISI